MTMTLAEKINARATGRDAVRASEIVTGRIDLAMVHDSSGPRRLKPILDRWGVGVWDPSKVVIITDHYISATDDETRAIQALTRDFVAAQGIEGFYHEQGICHVVLPERGHPKLGMFAVSGDSYSPTDGAFGTFVFRIGGTEDMLAQGQRYADRS